MSNRGSRRSRTGLARLRAAIKLRGLDAIDKRTTAAKDLVRWRRQLIADLGGDRELSVQKRTLVEVAVRAKVYLDHVDAWLLSQKELIDPKTKGMLRALQQRKSLAESLIKTLLLLGLDRQRGKPMTLEAIGAELVEQERREKERQQGDEAVLVPVARVTE